MIQYGTSTGSALDMADAAVSYMCSYLQQFGGITFVNGQMCVGDVPLQNNSAIVEMILERFGFGCTIFQENLRIATTAVAQGRRNRALGTTANNMISQRVYRRGEYFRGITRTLGKDWVIVYAPLRANDGKIVGMVACFREIVDFLHDLILLDCTAEAVLLLDFTGSLLDANSTACDMLGMSRPELMCANIQDFTEGLASRELLAVEADAGTEPMVFEGFWCRADQHKFPVTLSCCRMNSPQGPAFLTIVRDFTEEYGARQELRELNQKLARLNVSLEEKVAARTKTLLDTLTQRDAMLDHLSDGLLATDKEGVIEVVNPALITMMEWETIQPKGIPISILHYGLAELVTECIAHQVGLTDTMFLPNEVIAEARVSPIIVEDPSHPSRQRCMGSVVLVRDVTQATEAERVARESQRLELANKELALSAALSNIQSSRKSDFLTCMSHELRTPLNAIIGYAELIEEELEEAGLTRPIHDLGLVRKSGTNLLALINQLLDLSKIEAGKVEVDPAALALGPFLKDLEMAILPLVGQQENTFSWELSPTLTTITTDASKLRQVLMTLLGNACQFTEKGTISLQVEAASHGWVTLAIQDTGKGMSGEQAEKLFASDDGNSSGLGHFGGTGLGLTISQRICHLLGGDISVHSVAGEGSTFLVTLPQVPPSPGIS